MCTGALEGAEGMYIFSVATFFPIPTFNVNTNKSTRIVYIYLCLFCEITQFCSCVLDCQRVIYLFNFVELVKAMQEVENQTMSLYHARLADSPLCNGIDLGNLCGEVNLVPFNKDPKGKVDNLSNMMARCRLDDACVILSKYMNLPLLFTQKECNRNHEGVYVSRQARTYVSKSRRQSQIAKEEQSAQDRKGKAGKWQRKHDFAPKRDNTAGLNNRGWASVAPHAFFANSCDEYTEGTVLHSSSVVASGAVGFLTNMTTQSIVQDTASIGGGVCFSNEAPCSCCGIVPTNMAACVLGARKLQSSLSCLHNAIDDFREVFSAHEELFRRQHGLHNTTWSDCAECEFYYATVQDAADEFHRAIDVLQQRYSEKDIMCALDCVCQHRFKDSMHIQVDTDHGEERSPRCLLEQVGPLCEVVDGKDTHKLHHVKEEVQKFMNHKRLRLLEDTIIHLYNADGNIVTTVHKSGSIIEFPVDSNAIGTRIPELDDVRGTEEKPASRNIRRRSAANVGEVVRCSLHPRDPNVDNRRISKSKMKQYKDAKFEETENAIPSLVANLVVPSTVELYQTWQQRALDAYSKMELLNVVTDALPEIVHVAHSSIREEAMPKDGLLSIKMENIHSRGSPSVASLPLSQLRESCRDHRQAYHAGVCNYMKLIDEDQTFVMHVIDRWLEDWNREHNADGSKDETQVLGEIYHMLADTYVHGAGKYSDLDKFLVPLKLRMGIFSGVGQQGKLATAQERRDWKRLEIRGDTLPEGVSDGMSAFVKYKYDCMHAEGPYR